MQRRFHFAFVALCYVCVATGHEPFKPKKVDDGDTEGLHHSLAQTVEALAMELSHQKTEMALMKSKIQESEALAMELSHQKTEMALMKSEIQELRKLHSESNKTVGFTAWLTSETTVNAGDRVVFDGVLTNIGNNYNPSTGSFTVPVTGVYMFALQAHSLKKEHMRASIFNGVNVLLSVSADKDSDWSGSSTTVAIAQCTAGDHIYVEGIRDGDEIHGDSTDRYSSFAGYLLTITE